MGVPVDHDRTAEATLQECVAMLQGLRNRLAATGLADSFTVRALDVEMARVCRASLGGFPFEDEGSGFG